MDNSDVCIKRQKKKDKAKKNYQMTGGKNQKYIREKEKKMTNSKAKR